MSNYPVSNFIVNADRFLDYVPYVSTVTNLVEIVVKIALSYFEEHCPVMYGEIRDNPLVDHIFHQKNVAECVLLAIPFFNILVAYSRDFPSAAPANDQFNAELIPLREQANQFQQESMERIDRQQMPSQSQLQGQSFDENELHSIGRQLGELLFREEPNSAANQAKLNEQDTLQRSIQIQTAEKERWQNSAIELSEEHQSLIRRIAEMDKDAAIIANPEGEKAKKYGIVKEGIKKSFIIKVKAMQDLWKTSGENIDLSHLLQF